MAEVLPADTAPHAEVLPADTAPHADSEHSSSPV
jgi:hypothetical protein